MVLSSYTWGLDLSETLQGAGGVGGLLAMSTATGVYIPAYDGNGNVVAYVDASTETVVGEYEYSPFGEVLRATGATATFGFSTKYADAKTGLVYYGYRFYDPGTGRWLSRDPIGEEGGVNLYGFVDNDGVKWWDVSGLSKPACSGTIRSIAGGGFEHRTYMQNPNKPPSSNGCGGEGGPSVPDLFTVNFRQNRKRGDVGIFSQITYSFEGSCNSHDICYSTCGSSRSKCDIQFLEDLWTICYSLPSRPPRIHCFRRANSYYSGVRVAGATFFKIAQDKHCEWETCCWTYSQLCGQ
jgi:RHS repeat-associated protein